MTSEARRETGLWQDIELKRFKIRGGYDPIIAERFPLPVIVVGLALLDELRPLELS